MVYVISELIFSKLDGREGGYFICSFLLKKSVLVLPMFSSTIDSFYSFLLKPLVTIDFKFDELIEARLIQ